MSEQKMDVQKADPRYCQVLTARLPCPVITVAELLRTAAEAWPDAVVHVEHGELRVGARVERVAEQTS